MSTEYPRNLKRMVCLNGIFDPCQDSAEMARFWFETGRGRYSGRGCWWDIVSAPGGIGGYAHKLWGQIGATLTTYAVMGLSPNKQKGFGTYFSKSNPLQWKVRAKFRFRVAQDQTTDQGDQELSHCGGFCLDGNDRKNPVAFNLGRIHVNFNVAEQKCGITRTRYQLTKNQDVYKQAWSGSYDTWYDMEIVWERDWFADPTQILVTVYQNKSQLFSQGVTTWYWREYSAVPDSYLNSWLSKHAVVGRCGPHITCEQSGGAGDGSYVECYYKDISISMEHKIHRWSYTDSIIGSGRETIGRFETLSDLQQQFGEGDDIIIWDRESTSDNWIPQFRGIIRDVTKPRKKLLVAEAEGWESIFWSEKTENKSYTSQTADYIVKDIINDPNKGEFGTTDFVDATTATYTRVYPNVPKMDVLSEMAGLEGFILYFDHQNEVHFESYLKKQLPIHLVWGENRILKVEVEEVFARQPNIIRVIGDGYRAEREITSVEARSASKIIRTINRLELKTQSDVDLALDYYISAYREPIKVCTVQMRANLNISKGGLIALTVPHKGFINQRFLVASIENNHRRQMILHLLEAQPQTALVIADLMKRSDQQESQVFPQDDTTNNPTFNTEGIGIMLIDGEYEVIYNSVVQRSGKVTITDEFLDDLVEVWAEEDPDHPTHLAYGTGTTTPLWEDTALESETSRSAATKTYKELVGVDDAGMSGYWEVYRCIEFSIDISNPSGLTEIGLFNASSGGTMACRAAFASYTQSGTVTLKIYLRVGPRPSGTILTTKAIKKTIEWMKDGTQAFSSGELNIGHVSSDHFCSNDVHMVASPFPYASSWMIVPNDRSYGSSFTISKLYDRNMVKYEFNYPEYDYTEGLIYGGVQSDNDEFAISLFDEESASQEYVYTRVLMNSLHRSNETTGSFDRRACLWILFIKFEAGWIE